MIYISTGGVLTVFFVRIMFAGLRPKPGQRRDEMDRKEVLNTVIQTIQDCSEISAAKVYGSWLFDETSVDLDMAVMVPSAGSVVESSVYVALRDLRTELCGRVGQDIDLVPHTEDELTNPISPFWYPRYNPSLVYGMDIKGSMDIGPVTFRQDMFDYSSMAEYVILDNRTITRRQLARTLSPEEARIFASKLLHGPGNALTYIACKRRIKGYIRSPSDLRGCICAFDREFGLETGPATGFLEACKRGIGFTDALRLMRWYEHLVSAVLYGGEHRARYTEACAALGQF